MVALAEPALLGSQAPRLHWLPPVDGMSRQLGDEACAFARDALGMTLDPWEELVLRDMLATRPTGKLVCPTYVLVVSRRNGKTHVFAVRMLFALYCMGQRDVVYSAHAGETARETYRLVCRLIGDMNGAGLPSAKTYGSDGRERVELSTGGLLRFRTRTKSGGLGLDGETVVVDEAQEMAEHEAEALTPILGARTITGNPQLLFGGSSGKTYSRVFARQRRRGLSGDERLGLAEWSIDADAYLASDPERRRQIASDPRSWEQANPALGLRLDPAWLGDQLVTLDSYGFAREHLGVGQWPVDDTVDWPIPREQWNGCEDTVSPQPSGPVVFAVDASWDRTASIAVCGARGDGVPFAALVEPGGYGPGVDWVVPRVVELIEKHSPAAVVIEGGRGPAGPLIEPLEKAGVELVKVDGTDMANACGRLADVVASAEFAHRGQAEVNAALAGAKKRPIGDGWAWDRRFTVSDICPLVAITLARWGFEMHAGSEYDVMASVL